MYLHDTDINTIMSMDWVIVIILFNDQLWCAAGILLIWHHTYKDEMYSKWGVFNLATNFLCLRPLSSSYYLTSEQFVTCSMHPNSPHFAYFLAGRISISPSRLCHSELRGKIPKQDTSKSCWANTQIHIHPHTHIKLCTYSVSCTCTHTHTHLSLSHSLCWQNYGTYI